MAEVHTRDHAHRASSSQDDIERAEKPHLTQTMSAGSISISPEMFEKVSRQFSMRESVLTDIH